MQDLGFLFLNIILKFGIESGMSKQAAGSNSHVHSLSVLPIFRDYPFWSGLVETLPVIILCLMAYLMYMFICSISSWRHIKFFCTTGTILSYILIAVHWITESNLMTISPEIQHISKVIAPRMVYAIGFGLLILAVLSRIIYQNKIDSDPTERLANATVTMISAWTSTISILLGRQAPVVAMMFITGGTFSS